MIEGRQPHTQAIIGGGKCPGYEARKREKGILPTNVLRHVLEGVYGSFEESVT